MTASLHLAAGAATGVAIQKYLSPDASLPERALCAFIAGLLSHIFLDVFPHQEYSLEGLSLWAVILAETGLISALVLPSAGGLACCIIIFFAMVGSTLPDLLDLSGVYFIKLKWLAGLSDIMHLNVHGIIPLGFKINFWWQSLAAVLLILYVRIKSV